MARIRTIKPEFWNHPVLSRQDDATRLLAIALLNFADDKGYFHAEPNVVRGFCRPYDDTSKIIKTSLKSLENIGFIKIIENPLYGAIGHICTFTSNQKIDRPGDSKLEQYFLDERSTKEQRTIVERSSKEGIGVERKGKGVEVKSIKETAPRLVDPLSNNFPAGPTIVLNENDLRKGMDGQMFVEQACMALHCDESVFKSHLKDWIEAKVGTGDYNYPITKLRTFCLNDFKKTNGNAKPNRHDQTMDTAAAELEEMINQSKRSK